MVLIRMKLLVVIVVVTTVKLQCISHFGNAAAISEVGTDIQERQYTCLRESKQQQQQQQQNSSVTSPPLLDENSYTGKQHCWNTGNDLACEIATQSKARSLLPSLPGSSEKHSGGFLHSCNEPPFKGKRATTLVKGIADVSPWSAMWSTCEFCGLQGVQKGDNNYHSRHVLEGIIFDPSGAVQRSTSTDERCSEGENGCDSLTSSSIILSQTRWGVFFNDKGTKTNKGGQIIGRFLPKPLIIENECTRFVETPTFVFHLLTWHVGHILTDVIGPLHHTLSSLAGRNHGWDSRDILLVLDIDDSEERLHLHEAILRDVYSSDPERRVTPFSLLLAYTHHPIHTMASLGALPGRTCFRELHLGLDPRGDQSLSYQPDMPWIDVEHAGSSMPNANSELGRAMKRHADYSNFLIEAALTLDKQQQLKKDTNENFLDHINVNDEEGDKDGYYNSNNNLMECISSNNTKPGCLPFVTVIHREEGSGRHLVNERDIIDQARQMCSGNTNDDLYSSPNTTNDGWCRDSKIKSSDRWRRRQQCKVIRVDLGRMSLGEQASILQSTSILIGVLGSGLHNSIFMRSDNKAMIMFAPNDWCNYVTHVGNEAITNDLHVMIACQERNKDEMYNKQWHTMAWSARAWRQGPWRTKDVPVEVDLEVFKTLLSKAMNLSLSPSPSSSSHFVPSHHIIVTEVPDHMIIYRLLPPPPMLLNSDDGKSSSSNSTTHQPIPIPLFNNHFLHFDSGRAIACLSYPYWGVAMPIQQVKGEGGEGLQLSLQAYVLLDSIPSESLDHVHFCLEAGEGSDLAVSCWPHTKLSERSPLIITISRPDRRFLLHTWLTVHNGHGRERKKWPGSDNYYVWNGSNQNERKREEVSFFSGGGCFRPVLGLPSLPKHRIQQNIRNWLRTTKQQQYDDVLDSNASCLCDFESMASGIIHQPVFKFGILIDEPESDDENLKRLREWEEYSKNFPLATGMTVSPLNSISMVENRSACLKKEGKQPPHLPRYIMANACSTESIEIAKNEACLSVMTIITSHELGTKVCKAISLELMSRAAVELEAHQIGLPSQQLWPTPQRPFIFFHLEKCGGSSVRSILASSASRRRLHALIPCYTSPPAEEEELATATATDSHSFFSYTYNPSDKECLQFNLNQLSLSAQKKISVLAMHHVNGFHSWQDLPSISNKQEAGGVGAAAMPFDCFVMLRNPIERAISLFSTRIRVINTQTGVEISLNSLSVADLTAIIRSESDGIGKRRPNHDSGFDVDDIFVDAGMSDAACKMLCGATRLHGRRVSDPVPSTLPYDLNTAKDHLSKCVVGIMERWDLSMASLIHWFPWVSGNLKTDVNRGGQKPGDKQHNIKPELIKVLEDHNSCDIELFKFAQTLISDQAKLVNTHIQNKQHTTAHVV